MSVAGGEGAARRRGPAGPEPQALAVALLLQRGAAAARHPCRLPRSTLATAVYCPSFAVRVFPVKAYAFVNFAEPSAAIKAMTALEGVAVPALTGECPAARPSPA